MANSSTGYKDAHHIARLRQEQEKAIGESNERLQQLNRFKSDYIALKTRLKTLPDKVAYDVMVPFGKLAFMPGKLVHTNEILVLLGDNWFAEKSSKEASETVDRRVKVLDEQISDLEKQKCLLEPRLSFTSELESLAEQKGDMVEIKEEYDPKKEKLWKAEHKKKMQGYNKQRRQEEQRAREEYAVKELEQKTNSDKALWDRLDELERLEEQGHEMDRIGQRDSNDDRDSSSCSNDSEDDSSKTIRWKDQNIHKTIHFTHSKEPKKETDSLENTTKDESNISNPVIISPSDIYKQYVKAHQPKSILKQRDHTSSDIDDQNQEKCVQNPSLPGSVHDQNQMKCVQNPTLPGSVQAFSGEVHERPVDPSMAENKDSDLVQEPVKRVSKFKAQRMAKR